MKLTEEQVRVLVKMCEAVEIAQRDDDCRFTITVALTEAMRIAYNALPLFCADWLEQDAELADLRRVVEVTQAWYDSNETTLEQVKAIGDALRALKGGQR